jgi:hypothetical protein
MGTLRWRIALCEWSAITTALIGMKQAEESSDLILHLQNSGEAETVTLRFDRDIARAWTVNALEEQGVVFETTGQALRVQMRKSWYFAAGRAVDLR